MHTILSDTLYIVATHNDKKKKVQIDYKAKLRKQAKSTIQELM